MSVPTKTKESGSTSTDKVNGKDQQSHLRRKGKDWRFDEEERRSGATSRDEKGNAPVKRSSGDEDNRKASVKQKL